MLNSPVLSPSKTILFKDLMIKQCWVGGESIEIAKKEQEKD